MSFWAKCEWPKNEKQKLSTYGPIRVMFSNPRTEPRPGTHQLMLWWNNRGLRSDVSDDRDSFCTSSPAWALDGAWHLIRKDVMESSRAVQPADLLKTGCSFPPAVLCAWVFFAWYFARNRFLWWHDFVWCSDTDHNGDRVYVGKYHDIDGVNKNGFSVHRHLALRSCYGAVCSL